MAVDNVALLLASENEQELILAAARGPEASVVSQMRVPVGQNPVGSIALTRQPRIIDDLTTVEVTDPQQREQFRSFVGVPLLVDGQLIGVLHADSMTPRRFSQDDVRLLWLVAERLAYMLSHSRLDEALQAAHHELRASNEELRHLQAITDTALSHLTVDNLLRALLDRVHAVMGAEDAAILLLDADGQYLTLRAVRGLEEAVAAQAKIPVGHGFSGRIAATRAPLVVEDLTTFNVFHPQMRVTQRSAAGVPLLVEEQLLGVLYVGSAIPRRFSASDVRLLQRSADRIALAIDRARLFEREQVARREAEASQAAAEQIAQQLDRIFEGIADGLVVYDAEGKVVRTNIAARDLLGLEAAPSEYVRLAAPDRAVLFEARDEQGDLLAPEEWPLIRVLSGRVATGSDARDIRLRTLDGRDVDLTTSAAPLRDGDGRLVGAVTILHDRTERMRLEREREEALRSSEEWFHTMADTAPVLLWVAGTDTLVTFVNAPWLHFSGRSLDQELGNGWADGVHPDDYQRCLETYLTAFQARRSFTMEYRLRRYDGEYRWIVDSGIPHFAPNGSFLGYIGSAIDITERNQLERERAEQAAQLDRIFDQIAEPLLVYNAQGQIVRMNAATRRLLGLDAAPPDYYQRSQRERLSLYQLRDGQGRPLAIEDAPHVRALRGEVLTGADAMDLRVHTLDGREMEILLSAAPLRDREGNIIGAMASGIEMTERNQLAREREEARANELAAREVIQRLDTFIGIAAHDLRTPLTVSTVRLQMARRKVARAVAGAQQTNSEQAEALTQAEAAMEVANQSHRRLKRMVDLLLDVSRAQTGTLQLQWSACHLDVLVRDCIEEQRLLTPRRTFSLDLAASLPVVVNADADRICQVLINYLTNAIRYSPEDKPIGVALQVIGEVARVAVRDHGPGIPPAEQAVIWERFAQAQDQRELGSNPGLGLGLYIVRTLVELHGGQVGVASTPGGGATFWFTLPVAPGSDGTVSTRAPTPHQST
jgi:PAS domain S-box-containing protein